MIDWLIDWLNAGQYYILIMYICRRTWTKIGINSSSSKKMVKRHNIHVFVECILQWIWTQKIQLCSFKVISYSIESIHAFGWFYTESFFYIFQFQTDIEQKFYWGTLKTTLPSLQQLWMIEDLILPSNIKFNWFMINTYQYTCI